MATPRRSTRASVPSTSLIMAAASAEPYPSTPPRGRSRRSDVGSPAKRSVKKSTNKSKSPARRSASPGADQAPSPKAPKRSVSKKASVRKQATPRRSTVRRAVEAPSPEPVEYDPRVGKDVVSAMSAAESDDDESSQLSPAIESTLRRRASRARTMNNSMKATGAQGVGADLREWPLPFDVVWLATCTALAFTLAILASNPGHTRATCAHWPQIARLLPAVLPPADSWHIFYRCALLFVVGAIPLRRWANRHESETHVPAETITGAVCGIVKLALIQVFLFSPALNGVDYRSAVLHASLGFAVQEFVINLSKTPLTGNLQRVVELAGYSCILIAPPASILNRAMFYTLTLLSISAVLQSLFVISSSRRAYQSFRRAIAAGHTVLMLLGVPFIGNYLWEYSVIAANAPESFNPTIASVIAPVACGTILLASIVLAHLDLLFNNDE